MFPLKTQRFSVTAVVVELKTPPPLVPAVLLEKVQSLIVGELEILNIPPPALVEEFPKKKQAEKMGAPAEMYAPPPLEAVLLEKVQLFKVGEDELLFIPAPAPEEFPEKRQAEKTGELPNELNVPPPLPPLSVELLENVQLLTVGEDDLLYKPPPSLRRMDSNSTEMPNEPSAFPFSTVKPSKTVVLASLTDKTTW